MFFALVLTRYEVFRSLIVAEAPLSSETENRLLGGQACDLAILSRSPNPGLLNDLTRYFREVFMLSRIAKIAGLTPVLIFPRK
jgi:hypothetical protein